MTRVDVVETVDAEHLEAILLPRRGFVWERAVDTGVFEAERGPVRAYRRHVEVGPAGDGRVRVHQTVEYEVQLPYLGPVLARAVRSRLGALVEPRRAPWWGPPDAIDARAASSLMAVALLSVVLGYLGTLLTQTITFAAAEFGAGTDDQGVALAAIRADVLLTLALVALADRRGRRVTLLACATAACVVTATGALAPSLPWLVGSQLVARGLTTSALLVVGIVAVEEMPAGSRAFAVSVLSMTSALGVGTCVLLLFVADLGTPAWRLLYVIPLAGLLLVRAAARHLPESRRFRTAHAEVPMAGHGRRFWLLALSGFLFNLFVAPASQFQNEYLRNERGFSAGRISLFTVATGLPGGIGVVVGGRLAERGRRLVGAVAVVGGVGGTTLMYLNSGWGLWAASLFASVVGAAAVPALGVYGPELFPTSLRGRANGMITATARVGSVIGLLAAGFASARLGTIGPAIALLALGPAAVAMLVLVAYPETAHRELEELNPEDRPPV